MNKEETKQHAEKAATFITGLLTGWGVPAAWAKALGGAIIGAVIGALVAAGAVSGSTNDPSSPIGYAEAGEVRSTNSHHAAHAGGEISPSTIVNGKL